MASIGDLLIAIRADSKKLGRDLDRAANKMQRAGRKFASIGNELSLSLTLPIAAFGVASVKAAADFEKLEKSLVSAMGDTKTAREELEKLKEVAQAPGLGFEQAVKGSVRLQSVGLSADQARESLSVFGNAIALVGGSAADLDGVSLALAQIASKGKISAEEINQLAERVPQIRMALQDAFGTADTEALQKMGIDFDQFIAGVNESLGKLPKASNTLANTFENLQMAVREAFAEIGAEIAKTTDLQAKIEGLKDRVVNLVKWFINLPDPVKKAGMIIAGLAASAGPIMKVIAAIKMLQGAWRALSAALLMNPFSLVVVGIAAVVAAIVAAYKHFEGFKRFVDNLGGAVKRLAQRLGDALVRLNPFLDAAEKAERMDARMQKRGVGGAAVTGGVAGVSASIQEEVDQTPIVPPVEFDIPAITDSAASAADEAGGIFEEKLTPHFRKATQDIGTQFDSLEGPFSRAKESFLSFSESVTNKGETLSDKTGEVSDNLKQISDTINTTFSEENTEKVGAFFDAVAGKMEALKTNGEESAKGIFDLKDALSAVMKVTSETLSSGAKSFKEFARAAIASIAQVIKSLIAQSAVTLIAKMVEKLGLPGAIMGAVAAGGLIATMNGIINKVQAPALAKGGLAYGPTMAMVGDNPGARTDPEVIAPLSKLKDMISSMGGGQLTGRVELDAATGSLLFDFINEYNKRMR